MPVVKSYPFGSYCLYRVPKEKRQNKYAPNACMAIWVGHSSVVRSGHVVVPIDWDSSSQMWVLHRSQHVVDVKVYDSVFPLRKVPPGGTVGSQDFEDS